MTTFNVSNAAELTDALSSASGGDVIKMASGDYGRLSLKNKQFNSEVTLISEDPNDMASFSSIMLKNTSNLKFDSVMFDYEYKTGEGVFTSPFSVRDSNNITFDNSIFDGDYTSGTGTTADGTGTGRALNIRDSDGVDVLNSEFYGWWKGIAITDSTNVELDSNDIHTIRSDGITIGRASNVLIENNYVHDFGGAAGSGDHRDMIQIMRTGDGEASHNVTIRDNIFDVGAGDYAQTIFAGTDGAPASDPNNWHTNITIENNMIYNSHTHGITVAMTDGLNITSNTLIAIPRDETGGVTIPKIHITSDSRDVTIEDNAVSAISGFDGQSDWSVKDNVTVQNTNPNAPGYYDTQYEYYATAASDGYNQFGVKPGSELDQSGAGSSLADLFPMSYDAWVNNGQPSGGSNADGDNTGGDTSGGDNTGGDTSGGDNTGGDTSGGDNTSGDTNGGDNTGGDTSGGDNTDGDGIDNAGGGDPIHTGPIVFDDYVLDFSDLDESNFIGDASVINTSIGSAIQMDGKGDVVRLGRIEEFEDSEQLAFSISYARDEADGSAQRLVWNNGHLGLTIVGDGIVAHVANNDGKFTSGFRIKDLGLNDTDIHKITLMVDETTDHLQIIVDGEVVFDETDVDFDFVDAAGGRQSGWDLGFKHNRGVDGEIYSFAIDDDVQFVDPATYDGDTILG